MLYFITGNLDKYNEIKSIIPEVVLLDIDLPEIQSLSSEEVIKVKLEHASSLKTGTFIVEDGTFSLGALNGLPGTLIKWFLKTIGNDGLLKICQDFNNFDATASVTIGYCDENKRNHYFAGSCSGKIVNPRGTNGFGWDPIFQPDGSAKTYAEMTLNEKNAMSMRKIAVEKLKAYLHTHHESKT